MNYVKILLILASPCLGEVSYSSDSEYPGNTSTLPPSPPRPYSFEYRAGRFPGHVDRAHKELGDGTGTIYGSYSYFDPKFKIRTVDYKADENGFEPSLINFEDILAIPKDTEVVKLAKENHHALYEKIAENNARRVPIYELNSTSLTRARDRHLQLYEKIAKEHAAIAAQREAERLDLQATSMINDIEENQNY